MKRGTEMLAALGVQIVLILLALGAAAVTDHDPLRFMVGMALFWTALGIVREGERS